MKVWSRLRLPTCALAAALVAIAISACGSTGTTTGTGRSQTAAELGATAQVGPGLSEPTTGSGARIKGGTVTFALTPGQDPNFISALVPPTYCSFPNISELDLLLYRPLYWYGHDYKPLVNFKGSIGQKPIYSDGDKVVTVHLNHYMWSDGQPVTARNLVFWLNLVKANPDTNYCGTVPGKFPFNVVSYKALNATTFQMTLNRPYNTTWLMYNVLYDLTPIPMAWDRTSLSQPAPDPNAPNLPDTTRAGAQKVVDFLNSQSTKLAMWGSSPLWSDVDGPWRVQSTTSNGGVTFVPNKHYSGSPKATISKFVEVPFTSESSMVDEIKSQGAKALTVAYIPSQFQGLTASFKSQGYDVDLAGTDTSYFFPLNENAPKVGMIFRQLYFRQAFQHLVDQNGWIKNILHGMAVPTYGPVPTVPTNPAIAPGAQTDLYPFSVSDAAHLLKQNGWKVTPGGESTCVHPGTGPGDCGQGITRGEGIEFNIDYASGVLAIGEEMQDLQSQASKVGIKIDLTTHPETDVNAVMQHCSVGAPTCHWTAEYDGRGFGYEGSLPTGEFLFYSGSGTNYSNYSNKKMDQLVNASIEATPSNWDAAASAYVRYTSKQLPEVWVPQGVGMFTGPTAGELIDSKLGGVAPTGTGTLTPEDWYLTK